MIVGVLEAKNRLSELIEAAQRGEEVTITKRGEPVVRLTAIDALEERRRRATAALEEMDRIADAIAARGHSATWEEIKKERDEGRR